MLQRMQSAPKNGRNFSVFLTQPTIDFDTFGMESAARSRTGDQASEVTTLAAGIYDPGIELGGNYACDLSIYMGEHRTHF